FKHEHDDILLNNEYKPIPTDERIEPQFGDEIQVASNDATNLTDAQTEVLSERRLVNDQPIQKEVGVQRRSVNVDSVINYVADIRSNTPIPYEKLIDLLQQKFDYGKPVRWYGLQSEGQSWEEILLETLSPECVYIQLKGCLQLVDRS